MTVLFILAVLLVTTFVESQAIITRPDAVLEKLIELKELVFDYKIYRDGDTSLAYFLPLMRKMNPLILRGTFNYTIQAVKNAAEIIAKSDAAALEILAVENQNSCIKSLAAQINLQTEMSGFYSSDCLNIYNWNIFNITEDWLTDMETSGKEVDSFPQILINAFIGRNAFTQPDDIIARLQETYDGNMATYLETFSRLMTKDNQFALGWHQEAFAIEDCLNELQADLESFYSGITAQIPICRKYSGK